MNDDAKLGPVARRLAATKRVLCIEDEPDVAGFLRAYFRAVGYDLVHVDPRSVDEVLAALDTHRPDLVLLDIRLHGFSGTDAYKAMRSDDRWAFVPVIMVSAHATDDPSFEQPTGLDTIVAKPFNTNKLAELVEERLAAAHELAEVGRSAALQLFTHEYLNDRLADEIRIRSEHPLSFCLVRLRSIEDTRAEVGEEGLDFLAATLIANATAQLPDDAVIGITHTEEIAVVLPGVGPRDAFETMQAVLDEAVEPFAFPGGAVIPVLLSAGLATYPANARDADELFMAADAAMADAIDDEDLLHLAL